MLLLSDTDTHIHTPIHKIHKNHTDTHAKKKITNSTLQILETFLSAPSKRTSASSFSYHFHIENLLAKKRNDSVKHTHISDGELFVNFGKFYFQGTLFLPFLITSFR